MSRGGHRRPHRPRRRTRRTDAELGEDAVALTASPRGHRLGQPGPRRRGRRRARRRRAPAGPAAAQRVRRPTSSPLRGHDDRPEPGRGRPARVGPARPSCSPGTSTPSASRAWPLRSPLAVEGHRLLGRGASDMKGGVAALVVAAEELAARGRPRPRRARARRRRGGRRASARRPCSTPCPGSASCPTSPSSASRPGSPLAETLRGYALVEVTLCRPGGPLLAARAGRQRRGPPRPAPHRRRGRAARDLPDPGGLAHGHRRDRRRLPLRAGPLGPRPRRAPHGAGRVAPPTRSPRSRRCSTTSARPTRPSTRRPGSSSPASRGASTPTDRPRRLGARLERALAEGDSRRAAPPDGRFHAPYWMEAPLWQAAGIPALVCGPAGGGLHAADEWVDLRPGPAVCRRPHVRGRRPGRSSSAH